MNRDNTNIYLPFKAEIKGTQYLGGGVKLFQVMPERKTDYTAGQFFMLGRWGTGEVPISVTSTEGLYKHIEFAVRKVGYVTSILHKLKKGDTLWLRGPYGNGFSASAAKKRDVVFVAGGIGIVPLRSLIRFILKHKKQYKRIFLLYGSKCPSEILFASDLKAWRRKGIELILTVDKKDKSWKGNEGIVTEHLDKIETDLKKAYAYVCGPEVMIENTMKELSSRGTPDRQIITTLEARMKCGMGKCGQCYHGPEYICTNGPVYTYREIKKRKVYGP